MGRRERPGKMGRLTDGVVQLYIGRAAGCIGYTREYLSAVHGGGDGRQSGALLNIIDRQSLIFACLLAVDAAMLSCPII